MPRARNVPPSARNSAQFAGSFQGSIKLRIDVAARAEHELHLFVGLTRLQQRGHRCCNRDLLIPIHFALINQDAIVAPSRRY